MTTLAHPKLLLSDRHLGMVQEILHRSFPQSEIWAYGSRVSGEGHETSDLDLVVRNPSALGLETAGMAAARTAFVESNLPIRVDLMDWGRLPESFHREIERSHVVLQAAGLR